MVFGTVVLSWNNLKICHTYIHTYLYFVRKKNVVKILEIIVEGDPKAPFSIATTPRYWGGRYSIPWIALLYP